jgi:putative endonuclease
MTDKNLYIGSTNNIRRRLADHNSGKVDSTKSRIPFSLEAFIAVKDQSKAIELEQYFKMDRGELYYKKASFS